MKINELYQQLHDRLNKISSEADSEAAYILNKLFNTERLDFALNKDIIINEETTARLESILEQREKRIPLQYIFQEQQFRRFNFYVAPGVLIPRPETELLVDRVIRLANLYFSAVHQVRIVDIGCGSGAIAISLALEISNAIVYSVDISEAALKVAEINKASLKVPENKLKLIRGDKLAPFAGQTKKFDILVSNPPYIPAEQYHRLEAEVKQNEPEIALLGTDSDGLGFYRYFARTAKNHVNPGGFICLEIGYGQADSITDILKLEGNFEQIEIFKDYSNIERIVTARLNYENFTG